MKTIRINHLCILAVMGYLTMLLSCTSTPQIAGGSGAGNPGGPTTVALVVDTISSTGLGKTCTALSSNGLTDGQMQPDTGPIQPIRGPFPIVDQSGTPMTVTGATMTVANIQFVLDTGEDPAKLLDRFGQALSYDSESIILNGPFVFDAMTGVSVPPIDSLKLPEARYTGIKLLLDTSVRNGQPGGPRGSSVEIFGTFMYQSVQRNFTFRLAINQTLPFSNAQNVVLVQRADTVNFSIVFNPGQWLSGVNITSCLANGYILLENSGDLVVDGNTGRGPCQSIEGIIRENLISSGVLFAR